MSRRVALSLGVIVGSLAYPFGVLIGRVLANKHIV